MNDPESVEGVLVLSGERLAQRMKDCLQCFVVPGRQKLTGDNMGICDIPLWVNCLVVIGVSVIDVGSGVSHCTTPTTREQTLTPRSAGLDKRSATERP